MVTAGSNPTLLPTLKTRRMYHAECDVPVPGIVNFVGGIQTNIGKIWYGTNSPKQYLKILVLEKVPEPVAEKNFFLNKSLGTGIEKFGTENISWN